MDQQEAERLIALHADAVYRMAYIKTGKREDAEDITQETFLRMLRCGKTFRDEEHRRAWLLRVANNYAVDLLRAPWHKRCSSLEEVQAAAPVSEPELSEVLDAVLSLPEKYRAVIHLFYYEALSVAEIARILQQRQGAVRTQLCRGRALLREALKGEEQDV